MSIYFFGNCQVNVLSNIFRRLLVGTSCNVFFTADIHDIKDSDIQLIKKQVEQSNILIFQEVKKGGYPICSDDILNMGNFDCVIKIPSMYYDAYWPNQIDLVMNNEDNMAQPVDFVIYKLINFGYSDEKISRYLKTENIQIARRTVNKYRQLLKKDSI